MIGRNTSGGLLITSSPPLPSVLATRGKGEELGLAEGDGEGADDGDEDGDGDCAGVGEGGPCREKPAHGLGGTLAQSWCCPTLSPANGVTTVVKLPLLSLVTFVAALLGESQYRVIGSLAKNIEPLTDIFVLGPPAAVSRTMLALTGVGLGLGDGLGLAYGLGVAGVGDAAAMTSSQTGTRTRNLSAFIRTGEGYAFRSGARESTRPRSVRGSASAGPARRAFGG
jgi:hypothetical protein